jgi:hypothetical protein
MTGSLIIMNHSYRHDWNWRPPANWTAIATIDMHTGGEPLRVITGGLPQIEGNSVLEKRRYFREHYDHLRTGLMFEPRGHADMYGAVIGSSREADFDVFFLHNEGYSTMCGHAILALTKLVIETKQAEGPAVSFSVPAGRIEAMATIQNGRVIRSSFPSCPKIETDELMRPHDGKNLEDLRGVGVFERRWLQTSLSLWAGAIDCRAPGGCALRGSEPRIE